MTYYSYSGFLASRTGFAPVLRLCGPRGIRTLGLLNAIETRSQLRYGPIAFHKATAILQPNSHFVNESKKMPDNPNLKPPRLGVKVLAD